MLFLFASEYLYRREFEIISGGQNIPDPVMLSGNSGMMRSAVQMPVYNG